MFLRAYVAVIQALVHVLLRLALALDAHCKRFPRRIQRWRGSLHKAYEAWRLRRGLPPSRPPLPRHLRGRTRTPDYIERQLIRLHIEQPHLGNGQLRLLLARVAGTILARETIRKIIMRRQDLATLLHAERKTKPQRITVTGPRQLWGADLSVVFVLGIIPVWLLGIVDYHGSRLMALEPLRRPTSEAIAAVLERTIARFGAPDRLLTDNGSNLLAPPVANVLERHGVRHVRTKPAHPWTNGRIERIWRTFKETIRLHYWLLASTAHLQRVCQDFITFYNRDRPHSAWDGRTPDEVYFDLPRRRRPLGRVSYFDGNLCWYRFG